MNFEEILPKLRAGAAGRRSGLSSFNWVRLIVPQEELGVDGPVSIWRIFKDKQLLSTHGSYESEAEAKAALGQIRKTHTQKWTEYHKAKQEFDEAVGDPDFSGAVLSPIVPGLHKEFYKNCEVKERPASHRNRLNNPFFIAALSDGSIIPWQPTTTDLLALDWAIA